MNFDEIKKINFDECLCNENSIVILGNCLENSSKIADNSIDLIFADPPYNIGKDFGNNKDKWNSTDEYIFLYANNDSIMQRNKTRGKELSKSWIDTSFTDYQNEFYETVSKKIPNSRRISTDGKDKMYVSTIISQILNVQELTDRNL